MPHDAFGSICFSKLAQGRPDFVRGKNQYPMAKNQKILPPEAIRALAEAEERRKIAFETNLPKELGGRQGPEAVRYGDWEKRASQLIFRRRPKV